MKKSDLLARRDRLLGEGAPLFYEEPIHIVRGEGVMLYDADGRQYVDMYNNVPCVGHAHPRVVQAMSDQAGTLNVHSRYLHEGILDYAERLLSVHDDSLTSAVFACSGTEANEVALRMAREATGGRGIICTDSAYHGNSAEVGKLTRAAQSNRADPEIRSIPFPQLYRPLRDGLSGLELTELYLAEVSAQIEDFAANDIPFAGMLVCPLLANEGLPDIPEAFMARAADIVRAAGGLFITDEVQSGFCRTGSWWGYEVMGFVPDIVTMGKPMGNGLPLAGVVARKELVDNYRKQARYFNTFASSPLQAAVGMAVLEVIESEGLRENVSEVGAYMRRELEQLQAECEPMADVRGYGLFIGLEWVVDRGTKTP
ncbi:MAG: aminotransferase class III-fold pyridoxal phosphate-dependent enzyme, partial [Gammaproteobacteria bacterium]|nr:aminotransferase class III-fold pyridoxal phosphate-dependent enzyme [Gammaproteobacteria bacterium]